jgi:hypothetical protein
VVVVEISDNFDEELVGKAEEVDHVALTRRERVVWCVDGCFGA